MNIPLVSVCISAYNVAPYLSQAIEGILIQKTSFPFEIVIGEDCSSDDTRRICLDYKEQYPDLIHLVLHDQNVGVLKNNVSIVKQARGKYLAWCDGDDYWVDEQKLQIQYEILESHSDVALVHTDWIDFYQETGIYNNRKIIQNQTEKGSFGIDCINMLVSQKDTGCRMSSAMFRKVYFEEALNKNPELFLGLGHANSDFRIFIAMYERGRFYHIQKFTTVYRIQKESLSFTQNEEKRFRYAMGYFKLIAHIIKFYDLPSEVKNMACKRVLNGLLLRTFKYQKKEDALSIKEICNSLDYKLTKSRLLLYWGSVNNSFHFLLKPLFANKFKSKKNGNIKVLRFVSKDYFGFNDAILEFENAIVENGNELIESHVINRKLFYRRIIYSLDKRNIIKSIGIFKKNQYFSILMGPERILDYYTPFIFNKHKSIYLFDAWLDKHIYIEQLIKNLKVENVFFSSKTSTNIFKEKKYLDAKFHWIPEAIDIRCYKFKDYKEKDIDILAFGRNYNKLHQLIVEELHNKGYIYRYSDGGKKMFPTKSDFIEGLSRTKISLCFPQSMTHPEIQSLETMTVRYLQSMASKCLVVGKMPEEMKELFDYIPVIDLDMNDPMDRLEEILNNFNDYIPLIEKNYQNACKFHTWKNRWEQIVSIINEKE